MKRPITRALISVSDKSGLVEFCRGLTALGVEILSSGGTAKSLAAEGIPVIEVSDYTGFPEMMGGRIKTLHPKIHGGILGRRGSDEAVMAEHGIAAIDLVVVNCYPFAATIAKPDCSLADAIENIDIGGPTMIRAAAKNHDAVGVVVDPADYPLILEELNHEDTSLSEETRFNLAVKAFRSSADYDSAIANYLERVGGRNGFPDSISLGFQKAYPLRYGENPHQSAAFYVEPAAQPGCIATATLLQGKELSYNNIADADAALECIKRFNDQPACVIVKHANPCGVAEADNLLHAYEKAYRTDPTSAFGGIIAFNRPLDAATANAIISRQFVEVILAPEVDEEVLEVLSAKPNIRLLKTGAWRNENHTAWDMKKVAGGLLVQTIDKDSLALADLRVVTKRGPSPTELEDLLFAWRVAMFVKSNAIVYAREKTTIGIGAGQTSRVHSSQIGAIKAEEAGLEVVGSVVASDAFFPFRDGLDTAAKLGVTAVIQPGGSVRDNEIIAAADEHGLAMVFTGIRHFRH